MYLPSALEALERHVGLPPSLVRKAEKIRLEHSPAKIGASLVDAGRLARHNFAILDQVSEQQDLSRLV